jgi:Flp pilus assembly protein TadG
MPEFALVAPVLFLIIFGIFDFGRWTIAYAASQNAANEGGRVAVEGYNVGGTSSAYSEPTTSDVITAVQRDTGSIKLLAGASAPRGTFCTNGPVPSAATVQSDTASNTGLVFVSAPDGTDGSATSSANAPGGDTASAKNATCLVTPAASNVPLRVTVIYHFSPFLPRFLNIPSDFTWAVYSIYETEY